MKPIINIIKKGWQCKAGREQLTPYLSKDPSPTIPTHRMSEEKVKTVGDKKRSQQLDQKEGNGPAVETHQSHTIECGVTKIVPQEYWQGNKIRAMLRGSAARKRLSVLMCNRQAISNPHWHTGPR